jgi:hypothetical protein
VIGAQGQGIVSRVDGAMDFAGKLLATNPAFGRGSPMVSERLNQIKSQSREYLAHEYFNRDWHPMYFSDMAEWLAPAKVQFGCTADYIGLIDAVNITDEQSTFLDDIQDSVFRQSVRDFMLNQQFRKDYWVKGIRKISLIEKKEAQRSQRVILTTPRADVPMKLAAPIGEATLQEEIYKPLLDLMADHMPRSLGEMEVALKDQKILVVDKSFEKANDRTWCFWEKETGVFESLVCKNWKHISVHKNEFSTTLPTEPFSYKMIQGLDFYKHVIDYAKQFNNVYWQEATISSMETEGLHQKEALPTHAIVHWEAGMAKGRKVFSSILPIDDLYSISQTNQTEPFLWQHFKGHLIEFENPVFDAHVARLMDFNVNQHGATGFMYVLPLNNKKALVEYTLFSKILLKPDAYALEINNYLQKHYPDQSYHIVHEEIGAIPMTTQSLAKSSAPIYVIGTLGNAVKNLAHSVVPPKHGSMTGIPILAQTQQKITKIDDANLASSIVHSSQ